MLMNTSFLKVVNIKVASLLPSLSNSLYESLRVGDSLIPFQVRVLRNEVSDIEISTG